MMTRHWRFQIVFALLALTALALGALALTSGRSAAAPEQSGPIVGEYRGSVTLGNIVLGILSSPLVTPTPPPSPTPSGQLDMRIELSLNLQQSGTQVSGFVMLDRTLLYPRVTVIPATPSGATPGPGTPRPGATPLAIGPRVNGTFDGTTLRLTSERYELLISPSRRLINGYTIPEQKVTRQFSLVGTVQNNGDILSGEYRETVWGYGQQPSTAIGRFTLNRPAFTQFTADPTRTPGPPSTLTLTPLPPTATPTATSAPPTVTSTPTGVQPTVTRTPTGVQPTVTRTLTVAPPTVTATATPTQPASGFRLFLPLVDRSIIRP